MVGLYIHIPFCNKKCPYCNFYSTTSFDKNLITAYFNACLQSLYHQNKKKFDTIYIGGGTPSSIPVNILSEFIDKILKYIDFSGYEFSIEANPESVTDDFISLSKNYNISRISLGVQSLNDEVLKLLGRIHTSRKALDVAEKILKSDINLNTDMIFDIPMVNKSVIFDTAKKLCSLNHSHISAYSYTPDDRDFLHGFDNDETQYEEIEEILLNYNFKKYEISNFAKDNKQSIHNIIYWDSDEYIGIGASAHSMIYSDTGLRLRYSFINDIHKYINNPYKYDFFEELDNEVSFKESVIIGLRMINGINILKLQKMFGKMPINLLNNINNYVSKGLLEWDTDYLRTTKKGQLLLESLSSALW